GRDVDAVGRVDEHVEAGVAERGAELVGVPAGERRRVPALRVAEEELDDLSSSGRCHAKRVAFAFVSSDADHAPERSQGEGQPNRSGVKRPVGGGPGPAGAERNRSAEERDRLGYCGPGQTAKPPCAMPKAAPTKAATSPVTMTTRSGRVAEIICA